MIETVAVLSDAKLVKDIGGGLRELAGGETFTVDELKADMRTTKHGA
ncbi:hypothetical protein [Arthrobacter sp. SRS-W-1-2016]|nr:hypothetical protein [Arthrobacter sp. SRS-W-1-2016]